MKINQLSIFAIAFGILLNITSCSDDKSIKIPKPRMYPRIYYPVNTNYSTFDTTFCSFVFKYPAYSKISQDTFKLNDKPQHPCWFNIDFTSLNATLHCSYYKITNEKSLSALIDDAFEIAGKHNIKANYRKENIIENENGIKGIMFDIDGPVASPTQFFLTDEKNHFFRASLYFNSKVNPDSTAPVLQFLKPELDSIITSFKWK